MIFLIPCLKLRDESTNMLFPSDGKKKDFAKRAHKYPSKILLVGIPILSRGLTCLKFQTSTTLKEFANQVYVKLPVEFPVYSK